MTNFRFDPGCCCESCVFFEDDFDRADSSGLGADWTEVAGDWTIAGNLLRITTTGAVVTCDTLQPDGEDKLRVRATIKSNTNGSTARIIAAYQDSNNYIYGQASFGTGATIKLFSRAGGIDTELDTQSITLALNTAYEFVLCVNADVGFASFFVGVSDLHGEATVPAGGGKFGLGTGGGSPGQIDFNDVSGVLVSVECGDCGMNCPACIAGTERLQYQLVVAGLTDSACSTCESANGTYVVTLVADHPDGPCTFSADISPPICDLDSIALRLGLSGAAIVAMTGPAFFGVPRRMQWIVSGLGNPKNCTLDGLVLTTDPGAPCTGAPTCACVMTDSTVTVTAL